MKAKTLVTAALLLFVVASLAWLGVKEVRHSRAVKEAKETAALSTAAGVQPPTPAAEPAPAPPEVAPAPAPAPAPGPTPVPAKEPASAGPDSTSGKPALRAPVAPPPQAPAAAKARVIVYYLHTTARCTNCLKIEAYTASAVTGGFGVPLSDGRLEWKVVNTDEPQNFHFVEDYELFTKSVVVSEVRDGKEVRWKRLDKVWDFLGDQQAFEKYVKDEVRMYLGDA